MKSRLELICDYEYGKTSIKNIFFTPPYMIMHPFMDGDKMEVILMSASAGLLAGDIFECLIDVEENAYVSFLSQSYEKILGTKDDRAEKRLNIKVAQNATLKYMPFPAIPYANSDYQATNEIHLDSGAKLVYGDIFSCGRVGMGEKYGLKKFRSRTNIYIDDSLSFADHTLISPADFRNDRLGMWGNYTHSGMLYIYTPDEDKLSDIANYVKDIGDSKDDILSGVSKAKKGLIIRTLGYSGDALYNFNRQIAAKL